MPPLPHGLSSVARSGGAWLRAAWSTRALSTTPVAMKRVDRLRTPNYSSLRKHNRPDQLTGYQRRKVALEEQKYAKTPVTDKTRGFIPVRFKLRTMESDVTVDEMRRGLHLSDNSGKKKRAKKAAPPTPALKVTKIDERSSILAAVPGMAFPDDAPATFSQPITPTASAASAASVGVAATASLWPTIAPAIENMLHASQSVAEGQSVTLTPIQRLALPYLMAPTAQPAIAPTTAADDNTTRSGREVLLAAETGSGKTLAFLAPIIDALKREEEAGALVRKPYHPRAIVLSPSVHLVDQTLAVAKHLSHQCKFRAVAATHGAPTVRRAFQVPVDLVVGTPRALAELVRDNTISLVNTRWLVLDEADTLLDDADFRAHALSLHDTLRETSTDCAATTTVLAAATIPKAVADRLPQQFPNLIRLATRELHKARRHLHQNFLDLKGFGGSRDAALVSTLNRSQQTTMVFCNRRETCDTVHKMLAGRGIASVLFHGKLNSARVADIVGGQRTQRALRRAQSVTEPEAAEAAETVKSNNNNNNNHNDKDAQPPNIIICTDLASRGLDTTRVEHVILYDFPTTVVDYLHRIGRTGRNVFRRGHVTALVGKKERRLSERVRRCIRDHSILA